MVVKIDVDGVIRNINKRMVQLYNDQFHTDITEDNVIYYDVDESFPLIKKEKGISAKKFFFGWYAEELFLESPCYDGVSEAIKSLHDAGHKIIIVTWQMCDESKKNTIDFLKGIKYDDICFTKDKYIVNGDYIIDDNPEFLMNENEKARKICIRHKYNSDFNDKDVIFVNNLSEAVDYILEKK